MVVAVAVLVLMLLPASVWKAPAVDAVYSGFDRNLMFSTGGGGAVSVTRAQVDLKARAGSRPEMSFGTTLEPLARYAMTVAILDNSGAAEPLRVGVWSPWTASGFFIVFGPAPDNAISAELLTHGSLTTTLVDADVSFANVVGHYELNVPYALTFDVNRTGGYIDASVTPPDGQALGTSIRRGGTDLFDTVQLSLAASSSGGAGSAHAVLRDFSLTLPHQRWWAVKLDDVLERDLVLAVAGACAIVVLLAIAGWFGRRPRRPSLPRLTVGRSALLVTGAVFVYLVGNVLLFPIASHPFDFQHEELYTYVASTYGVSDLYYLPNFVSLARIWDGIPYVEAAFPYGPVFAYLYAALGWVMSALVGGAAFGFGPGHERIVDLLKGVNVLFGLADAALIFAIVRRIGLGRRWSYIAAALWLFNPAVWFSMSIWGQTHVISIFFVLVVVLAIERNRPLVAWLALAAALMTRPQMVVFGFLFAIVLLRKFPVRVSIRALSWTVVTVFLLLLPLTLAIGPTLPVDVTLNNFVIQQAGGNAARLSTVSQDAYSIWPLVTYVVSGASGLQRAFTPSSADVVGSLTYQRLGLILTVVALLAIGAALALRSREKLENGGYLPLVALGICSFLMLLTGVVATHFLLALPFLLLCRRWMGGIAYFYVAAIWTVTTLVPMYGDMGGVITAADYPALANSVLTRVAVGLYQWDRFITVSIVANLCALVWLAWLTFRRPEATPARA